MPGSLLPGYFHLSLRGSGHRDRRRLARTAAATGVCSQVRPGRMWGRSRGCSPRGTRSAARAGSLSRPWNPAYPAGAPGFVQRKHRRGDEDRAVGAGEDADEQGESEVAKGGFAEDQEGAYRDEGRERGVDRAHHDLPDRDVDHLLEAAAVVTYPRSVLPDPVEDYYGVIQRVAQDREYGDHRHQVHLPPDDGVEADRHEYVVHERDHRRHREGKLEAEADEGDDDQERCGHGLERLVADLLPERRAHARHAHLRPERLTQGVPNLRALGQVQGRGPNLVAVLPDTLNNRLILHSGGERLTQLAHAELPVGVRRRELGAAFEIYAEIQVAEGYSRDTREEQHARDGEPPPPAPDEVDLGEELSHATTTAPSRCSSWRPPSSRQRDGTRAPRAPPRAPV